MLFKGFGLGLFIVLAAVLMLGTFADNYEVFMNQHYSNRKSKGRNYYCNKMMRRRKMTRPNCKKVNTFIHETTNKIIDVCKGGGEAINDRFRHSKNTFRVTTCKMKGSSTRPPCDYRGNRSSRYIVIACEKGLPVHYDEGQI